MHMIIRSKPGGQGGGGAAVHPAILHGGILTHSADHALKGGARHQLAGAFQAQDDDRTRDATIALLQFEKWGMTHQSLGVFEDQEEVNRKVLARFTDVCEKQFSSLTGNRDRIMRFLRELIETGA